MENELMLKSLQSLFPDGSIWSGKCENDFEKFLLGLSAEFERARQNGKSIVSDFFPDTTAMLDEWEEIFSLPEAQLTDTQRQQRLSMMWFLLFNGCIQSTSMEEVFEKTGIKANVRVLQPNENPLVYIADNGFLQYGLYGGKTWGSANARWGSLNSNIQNILLVNGENILFTVSEGFKYVIPADSNYWGCIFIIETPDNNPIEIPIALRETILTMCYRIKPLHMWGILRAKFI